jgi:hypothetical protein
MQRWLITMSRAGNGNITLQLDKDTGGLMSENRRYGRLYSLVDVAEYQWYDDVSPPRQQSHANGVQPDQTTMWRRGETKNQGFSIPMSHSLVCTSLFLYPILDTRSMRR